MNDCMCCHLNSLRMPNADRHFSATRINSPEEIFRLVQEQYGGLQALTRGSSRDYAWTVARRLAVYIERAPALEALKVESKKLEALFEPVSDCLKRLHDVAGGLDSDNFELVAQIHGDFETVQGYLREMKGLLRKSTATFLKAVRKQRLHCVQFEQYDYVPQ